MPEMADPMDALRKLQTALNRGTVQLHVCDIYPELHMVADQPAGKPRFTYAKIEKGKVLSISLFVHVDAVDRVPCFQIGYAVVESKRQQGMASEIVAKGIEEMVNGFKKRGSGKFYVEAIVAESNAPSNKVARRSLSGAPKPCVDAFSAEPSMQYLRLVEF